jgi:sporulation protein YlmC with PRC-barrel domain
MLIVAKHIYDTGLEGSDGRVGTLYDLLFDDQSWKVQHLVVRTNRWVRGRQVLLTPTVIEYADWPERHVQVRLTREQARHSPDADADLPVERRQMLEAAAQGLIAEAYWWKVLDVSSEFEGDPHLHSTKLLSGLHIHCTDSQLGHVEDFVIDDENWRVADLVVATRNWWPGKRVVVEPTLMKSINWDGREIQLTLPREQIEHRPAYEGKLPLQEPVLENV